MVKRHLKDDYSNLKGEQMLVCTFLQRIIPKNMMSKKKMNKESKLEVTCHSLFIVSYSRKIETLEKKTKLIEVCSEQPGSSSDNDSEFSETSSKRAKEVANGISYKSNKISKKVRVLK